MGKKREKNFFPETRISRPKNDGKKSSGKVRKRVFLTHEYRDEKSGEKTGEKNFQKTHE